MRARVGDLQRQIQEGGRSWHRAQAASADPLAFEGFLAGEAGPSWTASLLVPPDAAAGAVGGFALWLGKAEDALSLADLREHRIGAIVNVALAGCHECQSFVRGPGGGLAGCRANLWQDAEFSEDWYRRRLGAPDFLYLALNCEDRPDFEIQEHFGAVADFLLRCRETGRPVLVHCMQGINRSSAVCAAFLARDGAEAGSPLGVSGAVDWIARRRQPVLENAGFLRQLAQHGYDPPKEAPESPESPGQPGEEHWLPGSRALELGSVSEKGHATEAAAGGPRQARPVSLFKERRQGGRAGVPAG